MVHTNSTMAHLRTFSLLTLLAITWSCRAAEAPQGLAAEINEFVADPRMRSGVLAQVVSLRNPAHRELGVRFKDDSDPYVRRWAWRILLQSETRDSTGLVIEGLVDNDYDIRILSAGTAGRLEAGAPELDAALRSMIATETFGSALVRACASHAQRRGPSGSKEVYELLCERGRPWLAHGIEAFALHPDAMFADVLESALDSEGPDDVCLASRGLEKLGLHPDAATVETMHAARFMTRREFGERWDTAEGRSDSGSMSECSCADLLGEAMQARVVVLGEAHGNPYVIPWQIRILTDLVHRWMGDSVLLVYETPQKENQGAVLAVAQLLGVETTAVEEEHPNRWSAHRRDDEAKQRMIELLREDPSRRLVVIYGDGHRESFVRTMRAEGIAAVGISLSGTGEMHADAIRLTDTLAVRDRVFRYDNGTYYVAAIPYAGRACAALDLALGTKARSTFHRPH